ncbi:GNAT family N-acetyltransferase [Rhizobium anhuiense]|nr:GNAT family N-acetyltransferase [Rhizobium anhuiense]
MEASLCKTHFSLFRASGGQICVAKRGSFVLGEIEFRLISGGHEAYISELMVDGSHRSKGIGTRLCSKVADYASSIGATQISVLPNGHSKTFYSKVGFSPSDRRYAIDGEASSKREDLPSLEMVSECDVAELPSLPAITVGVLQPAEQELYSLLLMCGLQGFPESKLPRLWKLSRTNAWIGLRPSSSPGGYARLFAGGAIQLETLAALAPHLCALAAQAKWRIYADEPKIFSLNSACDTFDEIWKKSVVRKPH